MTSYGLLVFDDAEELDFVGPWEVFTASTMVIGADGDHHVSMVAERNEPVRCAKGMAVIPHHTLDDHPAYDVVLVPGGMGTRTEVNNERVLDWLTRVALTATWMTSVCTGSLLLVASGVAAGKRVATHWGFEDTLDARDDCTVVRNARWVRDGSVVSSQGVSAGIDMALWLIGEIHGPAHARTVQRYLQYDPAPPYQADV
ncbi:MAG: DJ-1/PfpI family protein [Ilumatobacteraceae bacterium]|nr:DJ-1/PfpI family protein [Ilumatobacteraceae bacterium]